jgi:uncharacterized protein YjiS (DUF1127 family)
MGADDDIDLAARVGRKLTPKQWEELKQRILRRAQAARARALRDIASGTRAMVLELAAGARDLIRNWSNAYAVRRERRAAIRELSALDDRSLRDIGLGRSEIESAVYDPERLTARNLAVARYQILAAMPGQTAGSRQPNLKRTVEQAPRPASLGRRESGRGILRSSGYSTVSSNVARKGCAG